MRKKLTASEEETLFTFVKKHYVEYFDVQVELVDHLANDIEQQWEENPQLTFDKALDIAFKKFGIFGFSDLVEKKVNTLTYAYYKHTLQRLLDYISWPKIVVTTVFYLLIYFSLYYVNIVFPIKEYANTAITTGSIIGIVFILMYSIKLKKAAKAEQMKFLLDDVILNIIVTPIIVSHFTLIFLFAITGYNLFAASFIILFVIMTFYTVVRNIIPGIKEERAVLKLTLSQHHHPINSSI